MDVISCLCLLRGFAIMAQKAALQSATERKRQPSEEYNEICSIGY